MVNSNFLNGDTNAVVWCPGSGPLVVGTSVDGIVVNSNFPWWCPGATLYGQELLFMNFLFQAIDSGHGIGVRPGLIIQLLKTMHAVVLKRSPLTGGWKGYHLPSCP